MPEDRRLESYVELFDKFKEIELANGLTLHAISTIGGPCYLFWFTSMSYTNGIKSDYIGWWYQKEPVNVFLDKLNKLAKDFKKGLENES